MRIALGIALSALALGGCKATPPGALERAVAVRVKRVTVGGRSDRNPIAFTPENLERGRRDFSHYCMVCHGLDAQNTGVPFASSMSPPVPSLASPEVQDYTDGQLKWLIENGLFPSGMPASHDILSDDEMWRIVLWLRHLPPAGSLGEPEVYSGDAGAPPAESAAAAGAGPAAASAAGTARSDTVTHPDRTARQ